MDQRIVTANEIYDALKIEGEAVDRGEIEWTHELAIRRLKMLKAAVLMIQARVEDA